MRDADRWRPSKFEIRRGRLRGSLDRLELAVSSRVIADAVAAEYARALPKYARGNLLDLGCGKVPLFASYSPFVRDVTCVDWALSLHGSQHVDVACDLNEGLPLESASFDTVILSDVLEHIFRPAALLTEVRRVLRAEGHLLLNVPFLYGIHEAPHDYFRYTEFALRRLLLESGLIAVEVRPVGGADSVLADFLSKQIGRMPLVGAPAAALIHTVHSITHRLNATSATSTRFPLGYFLVASRPENETPGE